MYMILRLLLAISTIIVLVTIFVLLLNSWQKKHNHPNANWSKNYNKKLIIICILGTLGIIASGIILLLKMYLN